MQGLIWMGSRRKHSKITSILPNELITAINEQLVNGVTYEEIAAFIRSKGHEVSKSSVGRYGKDFLGKLERLRIVKEQAKTITESKGPSLEMTEAANQLALQLIMERLVSTEDLSDASSSSILKALALLESSAVKREQLKVSANKMLDTAVDRIKSELKGELEAHPEVLESVVNIVDNVAKAAKAAKK